ncbi:MAG TPA: response regulator transcription factor [Nitrospira sp.]|nr:response regulator transcription factor [Nitrospira sp.]
MTIARKIRVLLVEDHTLIRQSVRTALEAYPNIEVVGEAGDGETAVLSAIKLEPTAIVMDINMSKMDGITATRFIKLRSPHIAVVGLSVDPKDYQIYAMEKAGAFKVVNKNGALTELYEALQEAVAAVRPILVMEDPPIEKTISEDSKAKSEITDVTDSQFRTK